MAGRGVTAEILETGRALQRSALSIAGRPTIN
jgi:hypothetical protein